MRIRQLLQNDTQTLDDLYTAVFCAAVAQSSKGEWVIGTAVSESATAHTLQQFEWLGLVWDEGPEPEEDDAYNAPFKLSNTTADTTQQFDQTHSITHEILIGQIALPAPQTIRLPRIADSEFTISDLLDGDYLPTAVWHTLLTLGWPPAKDHERLSSYQVKQNFQLDQITTESQALKREDLLAINQQYIAHLPADTVAEKTRPYIEEWFGPLPMVDQWQIDLATIIRPQLRHFSDAPDVAGWAFADGWEYTEEAESLLEEERCRPILVSLVAELAHIVLLDHGTAESILAGITNRYPEEPKLNAIILSALTGQGDQLPLSAVMAILGKAQCLQRLGDALNM